MQFSSDNGDGPAAFYRTQKTKTLDLQLGDIVNKIIGNSPFAELLRFLTTTSTVYEISLCADLESAVILDLQRRMQKYSSALMDASAVASELDW